MVMGALDSVCGLRSGVLTVTIAKVPCFHGGILNQRGVCELCRGHVSGLSVGLCLNPDSTGY